MFTSLLRRRALRAVFARLAVSAVAVVVVFSSAPVAAPVTYGFMATVTSISAFEVGLLGVSVSVGDLVIGSYAYDPSVATADQEPASRRGVYGFDVPTASMSYTAGSFTFRADGTALVGAFRPDFILVTVDGEGSDTLDIAAGATIRAHSVQSVLNLVDGNGAFLGDDSIPVAYSGSDLTAGQLTMYRVTSGTFPVFRATVVSFGDQPLRGEAPTLQRAPSARFLLRPGLGQDMPAGREAFSSGS